jgi:hypothetical protein
MSLTRNKLYNSIIASKIEIDYNNIQTSIKKIKKQLSLPKLETIQTNQTIDTTTIYHMDALYRYNTNDKYELSTLKSINSLE